MQSIKFYTVGCKVNQYETQAVREQFIKCGFKEINNGKPADIYLVNTCTVTHKADRDCRRLIYLAHRENPEAEIIVTGCYTELDSDKIAQIPGVTHIVKNKDKERITNLFRQRNNDKTIKRVNDHIGITSFSGHTRAFLKIQDGCNNFCSYCKVPLVRNIIWSKPVEAVTQEAQELVKNGFKEIVLCGICLGSYGKESPAMGSLVDVITALEKIKGLLRIRLSSIEAVDVSDGLIAKMAGSQKLCPHLHIPLQSGDDMILKIMNRRYSRLDFLNLIKKIKNHLPGIAITTDVLVGFPGETEENFNNTVKLVKDINPLKTHIFSYSKRIGTVAAGFNDKVVPVLIRKRVKHLQEATDSCAFDYRKQFLNQKMDVLIESRMRAKSAFWQGHTSNYLRVLVKSPKNLKNMLIWLQLKKIENDSFYADLS